MSTDSAVQAGELAMALEWGEAELSEAIAWADALIAQQDTPDDRLIDISLASSKAHAISALKSLSETADRSAIYRALLRRIHYKDSMTPPEASHLAKRLYFLAMKDDAPEFLSPFASHWDAIDLAIDGVFGDPAGQVKAFLADLKRAANGTGGRT